MQEHVGSIWDGRKVLVTGATGLVGGAVARHFRHLGANVLAPSRTELDLRDHEATRLFFERTQPSIVIGCAARVGGIAANMAEPVRFLTENIEIQNSTLLAAASAGVEHFVFLASSCIYPRDCSQPMRESMLMTGLLEPTNESYAIAKLAGIQLARSLQQEGRLRTSVLLPCNIYGPGDSFDPQRAHVTSALVRKFVDATREDSREVTVWGTGKARRELMHSHDLAAAVERVLLSSGLPLIVNVGTGRDHSIMELAEMIAEGSGFNGEILYDDNFPDGMPQKVLDVTSMASVGWRSTINLETGVAEMIETYRSLSAHENLI